MRRIVLHPFFLAIFPAVFLWAQGGRYGTSFGDVAIPLALSLAVATAVFALLVWALKWKAARAGIVVSLWIILFFSYGYLGETEAGAGSLFAGSDLVKVVVWLLAGLLGTYLLKRTRRMPGVTEVGNYVAMGLVVANLSVIGLYQVQSGSEARIEQSVRPPELPTSGADRPDIYYIVLEEYAGERTLRESFGYDNSWFLDALEDRGFYLARSSSANYPRTALSVASSLNMGYIQPLPGKIVGEGALNHLIEEHAIGQYLKRIGYRYLHAGSWWDLTATNRIADAIITRPPAPIIPTLLYAKSLLRPIGHPFPFLRNRFDQRDREYGRILNQFEEVAKAKRAKGPKFVFAHVMSPHAPYVFDRDGGFVSRGDYRTRPLATLYVDQLIYVNKLVIRLVDELLSGEEERSRPIVIVQADEGPYPGEPSRWGPDPSDQILRQKFELLNALYFPNTAEGRVARGALYPTLTPVNDFRVVLRAYFDPGVAFLPDRNYTFRDLDHVLELKDVTSRLRTLLR
jgi:hypothetical protein